MIRFFDSNNQQNIRFFISSTFSDMHSERDILINSIFPRLRNVYKKRMVNIAEVDLRWGISEEAVKSYKLLELCLREVLRCSPFFIGIIGDKYGTIVSSKELENLRSDYRDAIGDDIPHGISLTELEIRAGVFIPRNNEFSCFFIKKQQPSENNKSVINLIKKIKQDYIFFEYESLQEFGENAFILLQKCIEKYCSSLHNTFCDDPYYFSHLAVLKDNIDKYIPDNFFISKLLQQLQIKQKTLVCGEKGFGKTACLSWIIYLLGSKSEHEFFFHFAISGTQSKNTENIFTRLKLFLESLSGYSSLELDPYTAVIDSLRKFTFKKLYLFFDAVEQYDDPSAIYKLFSLTSINSNIFVVCSSTDDKIMDDEVNVVHIQKLKKTQIEQIAKKTLSEYRKNLNAYQLSILSENKNCSNPTYLQALLTQLRIYGNYNNFEAYFHQITNTSNIQELFQIILQYFEQYFQHRNIPTEKLRLGLTLIMVSKNGISEKELQEIAGLYPIACSALMSAIQLFILENDGRFYYNHDLVVSAIQHYLDDNGSLNRYLSEARYELINYYMNAEDSSAKFYELPFQLLKENRLDDLKSIINTPNCFMFLLQCDETSLIAYLSNLIDKQDEMLKKISTSLQSTDFVRFVHILTEAGWYSSVVKTVFDLSSLTNNQVISIMDDIAWSYYSLGLPHFREAIIAYQILLNYWEENFPDNKGGYAYRYSKLGRLYQTAGEFERAFEIYQECVNILDTQNFLFGNIYWIYSIYGKACLTQGKLQTSLFYFNKAIDIAYKTYGKYSSEIAWIYSYAWVTYYEIGNTNQAIEMAEHALSIYDKIYAGKGPRFAWALLNCGIIDMVRIDYKNASKRMLRSIKENDMCVTEKERPHPYSITAYCNLANIYELEGKHLNAKMTIEYVFSEGLKKYHSNHMYMANIYLCRGIISNDVESIHKAVEIFKANTGNVPDYFFAMVCLARIYYRIGYLSESRRVINICLDIYNTKDYQTDIIKYLIAETYSKIYGKASNDSNFVSIQ